MPKPKAPKPAPKTALTHIKDLVPDPSNRRQHNPRNIGMVVDALHAVGAARSIVIDEDNVVLAGNGVVEAAGEAGITRLRVIEADGQEIIAVRRSGLSEAQKRHLAIADNRSAELAQWNAAQFKDDLGNGLDFAKFFSPEELAAILGTAEEETESGEVSLTEAFQVLVTCKGEGDQADLLERLSQEGYLCRALMS